MPRGGHTLVELLVGLVILSVLTSLVALAPTAHRPRAGSRTEAVNDCRLRAVRERREVVDTSLALLCLPDGDTLSVSSVSTLPRTGPDRGRPSSK